MLRRIAVWTMKGLLGATTLVIVLLTVLVKTPIGHRTIAWFVGSVSNVTITGLDGDLPDDLRARTVEISDAQGVWLHAENVSLNWSALSAFGDHIRARRLSAARIAMFRRPVSSEEPGESPLFDIDSIAAPRIEIAKSIVGRDTILRAQGSLRYKSLRQWRANVAVVRIDNGDTYRVRGAIEDGVMMGTAFVAEKTDGILGALLDLPMLGPVQLNVLADGRRNANHVSFRLKAGGLTGSGQGVASLGTRRADLDISFSAPAMRPRSDLSWQSLTLDGHVRGAFDAPWVQGRLEVAGAEVAGFAAAKFAASVRGDHGGVDVDGTATALRIPGSQSGVFASSPVAIRAHADLRAPDTPVDFRLSHRLLAATGRVNASGKTRLVATVEIPGLAPFAALAGEDVRGSATFAFKFAEDEAGLEGTLNLDGPSLIARLLGRNATISLHTRMNGSEILDSDASVQGVAVKLRSKGSFRSKRLDYTASVELSDLSRLANTLSGKATLSGKVLGPLGAARATATGEAMMASKGFAPQHVAFDLAANGFPELKTARIRAGGSLDGSSVSLLADLSGDGMRTATATGRWKSLALDANFTIPQKGSIAGRANVKLGQLSDLATFIGEKIEGSVAAKLDLKQSRATIDARAANLALDKTKIGEADLSGTVADPFGRPSLSLAVKARGIEAEDINGDAQARLNGPLDSIAVSLSSTLDEARLTGEATVHMLHKRAVVRSLSAEWRKQTLTLQQPMSVEFAKGLTVDRLLAHVAGGELQLVGRLTPVLAANASVRGVDAGVLRVFMPDIAVAGTLSATADLRGTLAAPQGSFMLQGRGLRAKNYSSKAVVPANLDVHGTLHGRSAALNAILAAGPQVHLTLTGEAGQNLQLHSEGALDIAMFSPALAAGGRQAKGNVTVNADIAGSIAAPRVTGVVKLAGGEIQDFARGVHVTDINAGIRADGEILHIADLAAKAGDGTIAGRGTIDLAQPGWPLELAIEAHEARPIVSDLVTATLSGNLTVTGELQGALTVAGKLSIAHGEINLPDRFPPEVAVLDVRRKGQALPPPALQSAILLDIAARTSGQIFVRGHGIDAVLGGRIRVSGTVDAPQIDGGFDMKRGTLSIAGQTLTFTTGKLSFDGIGIRRRLDPTLNFVAQTNSGWRHRDVDGRRLCVVAEDHAVERAAIAAGRNPRTPFLRSGRQAADAAAAGADRASHRCIRRPWNRLRPARRFAQAIASRPAFVR